MYDQSARRKYLTDRGFEPRTTAWRPGLAAASLRGKLEADRYEEGVRYQCIVPATQLRFEPETESPVEDQLIFGQIFVVFAQDIATGLSWGRSEHDNHVGFVRSAHLSREVREATHWVARPFTPVLPRPDRKAEPVGSPLPLNARVTVEEIDAEDPIYACIGKNQWVFMGDLRAIGDWLTNPVDAILPFGHLGTPYVWGHNDGLSFDCSGLTQAGWRSMGVESFRDADQQESDLRLGSPVGYSPQLTDLRPMDQIYWPNHLAIMVDERRAIHAKGSEVRRAIVEPIADIRAWRLDEFGQDIRTVKRR